MFCILQHLLHISYNVWEYKFIDLQDGEILWLRYNNWKVSMNVYLHFNGLFNSDFLKLILFFKSKFEGNYAQLF